MDLPNTRQAIIYQQRKWAATHGIKPDAKNYTQTLEENLFQPLTAETRADYASGRGNEIDKKMRALHSSSALVCNVWYDYPSSEAAAHRTEVETFMQRLGGEIDFRAMTYQELFNKVQGASCVDANYITYLKERYFP